MPSFKLRPCKSFAAEDGSANGLLDLLPVVALRLIPAPDDEDVDVFGPVVRRNKDCTGTDVSVYAGYPMPFSNLPCCGGAQLRLRITPLVPRA